jgi:hypothetical protein
MSGLRAGEAMITFLWIAGILLGVIFGVFCGSGDDDNAAVCFFAASAALFVVVAIIVVELGHYYVKGTSWIDPPKAVVKPEKTP